MPTELPGLTGWPPRPALGARIASRRTSAPDDPKPRPSPEPARHEPLPNQTSFLPEDADPSGQDLGTLAEIPAAALGDRRLADVDYCVLGAVSLLAGGVATTRATNAEISQATAGWPSAKAVPRSLERLAAYGYLFCGPDPGMPDSRLIFLPWRLQGRPARS